jgi:hypothetical protein
VIPSSFETRFVSALNAPRFQSLTSLRSRRPHLLASPAIVIDWWTRWPRLKPRSETLIVYTAIFGAIPDVLRAPRGLRADPSVGYVSFSDAREARAKPPWETRPAAFVDPDARRMARYHKTLSHVLFPEATYTIWHDGNIRLKVDPWKLVDEHLGSGVDVASFRHRDRGCVYEELEACIRLGKDDPALMTAQIERYRAAGYPDRNGLAETGVLVRRHTARVREFNEAWWREIENGSVRDQLSFDYVRWRLGLAQAYLPGQSIKSKYADYTRHR